MPLHLLDVDLARLGSLSLGDDNAQDAVLEAGLDIILVDASWEGERAVELANRTLADPVFGLRVVVLGDSLLLRLLCDLVVGLGWIVLDLGLVAKLLLVRLFAALDEALWALTFLADVLVAARNG